MSDRFIREDEAREISGLSRTTRWRRSRDNKFPQRYKISDGIKAYKESEIIEWLESRSLDSVEGANDE